MKRLIALLISLSFVLVFGCTAVRTVFLGEEPPSPVYVPNENCRLVGFGPGLEPDGFNGVKWETDVSTLQGLKLLGKDPSHGGIEFYSKEKDPFRLGNGKIRTVQYGFWKEKFYTGVVTTETPEDFNALKEAVFAKFGAGAKPFINREEYLWVGKETVMCLRYDDFLKSGIYYVRSDTMAKKMTQNRTSAVNGESAVRLARLLLVLRASL